MLGSIDKAKNRNESSCFFGFLTPRPSTHVIANKFGQARCACGFLALFWRQKSAGALSFGYFSFFEKKSMHKKVRTGKGGNPCVTFIYMVGKYVVILQK